MDEVKTDERWRSKRENGMNSLHPADVLLSGTVAYSLSDRACLCIVVVGGGIALQEIFRVNACVLVSLNYP